MLKSSLRVIGITGRKYAGKDTVANYLCGEHGFVKLSFAAPLKETCKQLFGLTDDQVNGNSKEVIDKRWNVSPRRIMQFVGTELYRNHMGELFPGMGRDFWIEHMKYTIGELQKTNSHVKVVISDVRFQNEIDFIHDSFNGEIWRVHRETEDVVEHESENNSVLLDVDIEIENDGDGLKHLHENIELKFRK